MDGYKPHRILIWIGFLCQRNKASSSSHRCRVCSPRIKLFSSPPSRSLPGYSLFPFPSSLSASFSQNHGQRPLLFLSPPSNLHCVCRTASCWSDLQYSERVRPLHGQRVRQPEFGHHLLLQDFPFALTFGSSSACFRSIRLLQRAGRSKAYARDKLPR